MYIKDEGKGFDALGLSHRRFHDRDSQRVTRSFRSDYACTQYSNLYNQYNFPIRTYIRYVLCIYGFLCVWEVFVIDRVKFYEFSCELAAFVSRKSRQ